MFSPLPAHGKCGLADGSERQWDAGTANSTGLGPRVSYQSLVSARLVVRCGWAIGQSGLSLPIAFCLCRVLKRKVEKRSRSAVLKLPNSPPAQVLITHRRSHFPLFHLTTIIIQAFSVTAKRDSTCSPPYHVRSLARPPLESCLPSHLLALPIPRRPHVIHGCCGCSFSTQRSRHGLSPGQITYGSRYQTRK